MGIVDGTCDQCDIAAIVLNWKTPDLTARSIESVLSSAVGDAVIKIIVVDNASGDESIESLSEKFGDKIEIIASSVNNGFAGGMNIGLARAKEMNARYSFLLNSDIKLTETTIAEMLNAADAHLDGAFFGPRIYADGKSDALWFVEGRWDWGQGTIRCVFGSEANGRTETPHRIEFVNGAAMFVRMDVFEKIGVFDERFGLYFEESDLCARAVKAGFTLWHVPNAAVWHICEASMAKASAVVGINIGQYYRTRNRLLWGRKNLSGARAVVFWWNAIIRLPIKSLVSRLKGRLSESRGVSLGIKDFLRGNFGMHEFD